MMHLRRRSQNKPTVIAACLGAGIALASGTAAAVQATKWEYATDANFVAAGTQFGAGGGAQINTPDVLAWGAAGGDYHDDVGASDNQSALTIGTGTAGALRDNGGPVGGTYVGPVLTPDGTKTINTTVGGSPQPGLGQIGLGVTFTHWNNPIDGSFATLTHGRVQDELSLRAIEPNGPYPGVLTQLPSIVFDFEFVETNNAGPCAGGLATPCPDLFGIVGTPNLNVAFNYLDPVNNVNHQYLASIFVVDANGNPTPFTTLTNGECAALGLGNNPCQGFRTAEGQQTTVQFAFAITTERLNVPEPGTLPLFGLALAWLGFAARRRSS